jgi:hypothetical protein
MHAKEPEIWVRCGGLHAAGSDRGLHERKCLCGGVGGPSWHAGSRQARRRYHSKERCSGGHPSLQDPANLAVVIKDGKKVKLDDQGFEETSLTF